jgi:CheY-like chemotaxis protein
VLLDHQMPDMNGATTARLVRMLPGAAGQVPIIGFTAGNTETTGRMRAAGVDDILTKPFDRTRLADRLQGLLDRPAPPAQRDPVDAMTEVLAGLPAAARQRLAGSIASDLGAQSQALAAALDAGDAVAAATALHALTGVAATLGLASLADRCRFAEATLAHADPARCGWMVPMIKSATDAARVQIAAVTTTGASAAP